MYCGLETEEENLQMIGVFPSPQGRTRGLLSYGVIRG
jgi:hypothetical protein